MADPLEIAAEFAVDGVPTSAEPWTGGLINQSYQVTFSAGASRDEGKLVHAIIHIACT
jgi:hypothetical protein